MKKFLVTILQLLAIAVAVNAQTYKYTSSNLNLRDGPSTAYKILATIPLGTSVEMAEECDCDWIKVSYKGNIGYVSSKYLTNQIAATESPVIHTNIDSDGANKTIRETNKTIKYYRNSDEQKIQSPTYYDSAPVGATALCRDGTYSFSANRRGTCSGHGGVSKWLR